MTLNKIFVICIILLCCISPINASESISGYVFDDSNNALNGVTVSDNATIGTTTTNTTGYYSISGYTNLSTYILTASKNGYVDNTLSIDVNGNMSNQNITVIEKGRLYDIFEMMENIIDNTGVIVGMVIFAVTIGIVIFIGAWITKLLQKTVN